MSTFLIYIDQIIIMFVTIIVITGGVGFCIKAVQLWRSMPDAIDIIFGIIFFCVGIVLILLTVGTYSTMWIK